MNKLMWKLDINDDGSESYFIEIGENTIRVESYFEGSKAWVYFNDTHITERPLPSVNAAKRYARKWLIQLQCNLKDMLYN